MRNHDPWANSRASTVSHLAYFSFVFHALMTFGMRTRLVGSAFCQDVLELVGLPLEGDDPVVDDLEPGRLLHRHPRLVVRPLHRRHGLAVVLLEELVKGLLGQPQLALGPV